MVNFIIDGQFVDNLRSATNRLLSATDEKADSQLVRDAVHALSAAVPHSIDNGQTVCDYRAMGEALSLEYKSFLTKGPQATEYPKWLHEDLQHTLELIHRGMVVIQQVVSDIAKIITLPLPTLSVGLKSALKAMEGRLGQLLISYNENASSHGLLSLQPLFPPFIMMPSPPGYPSPMTQPWPHYMPPLHIPDPVAVPHFPPVEIPNHRIPTVFAPMDEQSPTAVIPRTGYLIPTDLPVATGIREIPDMRLPFDPRLAQIPDELFPTGPLSRHVE